MNLWSRLDEKINWVENVLITVLLAFMILVAFSQIVLRNFLATGIDWGDSLVRYLVVWVAFIGAAVATREDKHLSIDVLSRWFTGSGRKAIQTVSCLASASICGLLTLAAIKFVGIEAQMGSTVFFKLPAWIPAMIIPITFGLMTVRFAVRFLSEIAGTLARTHPK
jgi:TRAP-type C4-dicarboxylate transport system permease small subunit